jgi:hypothetical protein
MKRTLFFLLVILFHHCLQAQSPVGKWKLTTGYSEDEKGKKTDLLKDMIKEHPCVTSTVFEFTANGKMSAPAKECPAELSGVGLGTKYKFLKNKIQIFIDEEDTDPTTYNIEFIGNKMRWTINYTDVKGIRLLLFEYTRA